MHLLSELRLVLATFTKAAKCVNDKDEDVENEKKKKKRHFKNLCAKFLEM